MAKHSRPEAQPAASKKKKKKKSRPLRWLWGLLIALLCIIGLLMAAFGVVLWKFDLNVFDILNYNHDKELGGKSDEDLGISDQTEFSKDVTNIALFGVDSRSKNSFNGNTDSIMIISIDQVHNKVKLVSIMRDTLVHLDGYGYAKINSAYAKGGAELALKTLNQSFNLNIRDYAIVNFIGMMDIIESVGGIDVNVTESERNDANIHIGSMHNEVGTPKDYIRKAGQQTLNGVQAVAWARIRHVSTADGMSDDYGRTDRQRYVMEQLFNKALSAGKSQYPAMIKALLPYTQTSLDYGEILSLAGILTGNIAFEQSRVPLTEYQISGDFRDRTGSSTVYYDLQYAGKVIHAFIYDDKKPEDFIAENGVEKNRWAG